MIVDIVIGLSLFISGVIGLKSGFIKTIFKFVILSIILMTLAVIAVLISMISNLFLISLKS